MICINGSFYGIHTLKEICDMFERQPDTDQVVVAKVDDNDDLEHITYFVGENNSHGIEKYTKFNKNQQMRCGYKDKKLNVVRFYTLANGSDPKMAVVNVIVKDVEEPTTFENKDNVVELDQADYISIDQIRQKYCWRDDVECVILHNAAVGGSTIALLLNESNAITFENKTYNDSIVKFLKEKKEHLLADVKNKYYATHYITQFVPLDIKQTKFNVHIYGYFTDMMGLISLKRENKNNDND